MLIQMHCVRSTAECLQKSLKHWQFECKSYDRTHGPLLYLILSSRTLSHVWEIKGCEGLGDGIGRSTSSNGVLAAKKRHVLLGKNHSFPNVIRIFQVLFVYPQEMHQAKALFLKGYIYLLLGSPPSFPFWRTYSNSSW